MHLKSRSSILCLFNLPLDMARVSLFLLGIVKVDGLSRKWTKLRKTANFTCEFRGRCTRVSSDYQVGFVLSQTNFGGKSSSNENKIIKCGNLNISNTSPFTLIAGPCQLENEKHALNVASDLKEITQKLDIGLIYKTSFDKANRTSLKGIRGAGLE